MVFMMSRDTIYYMDFSSLKGVSHAPAYFQEYETLKNKKEETKELYIDKTVFQLQVLMPCFQFVVWIIKIVDCSRSVKRKYLYYH